MCLWVQEPKKRRRGCQIPGSWGYRCVQITLCVLGKGLGSSDRVMRALNHREGFLFSPTGSIFLQITYWAVIGVDISNTKFSTFGELMAESLE